MIRPRPEKSGARVPTTMGIGKEAAGALDAVGADAARCAVRHRVAYLVGSLGADAGLRNVPAERLLLRQSIKGAIP